MSVKKISGIVLVLLGTVLLSAGIFQYGKSSTPNTCIVSFSKSLGGKASMVFENSIQRGKYYGMAGISVGGVFFLVGGALFIKSKK
ncbi:MAG: hypothetical protein PF441_04225 [Desulfuromusa sp.]|jgi:hypothetical protein|nr:hypothetical protein [Desulfuromusa sp.]